MPRVAASGSNPSRPPVTLLSRVPPRKARKRRSSVGNSYEPLTQSPEGALRASSGAQPPKRFARGFRRHRMTEYRSDARRLCPGTRRSSGRPPRIAVRQQSYSHWARVSGMPPGRDCDVGQMAMGARFPAIRRFGRAGLEYFYKEEAHRAKPPRRNDPGQGGQSASHFSLGGHRLSSLYRAARVAH